MNSFRQAPDPPVLTEPAAIVLQTRTRWLIVILLTTCLLAVRAADPYSEALDKRFSGLDTAVAKQVGEMAQAREAEATPPPANPNLFWQTVGVVAGVVALRITLRFLGRGGSPKKPVRRPTPELAERPVAGQFSMPGSEEVAVDQFEATAHASGQSPSAPQTEGPDNRTVSFLKLVPKELEDLQRLLLQAARSDDAKARQKMLLELSERLRYLCYSARQPELRPLWQIAVCLEELLKKLAGSSSMVTTSELRTAAGGLEVMHDFCSAGENFRPATEKPARLLVVDDDAVSRFAISAALKEAVNKPDLASDGQTGLSLAEREAYDAIFLDVEMPGMDGFELCAKIHKTPLNPSTPVVFVTQHSDFEARTKAAELGGHDLIGKPFLPLEITVKALTLILRSRLQHHEERLESIETKRNTVARAKEAPRPEKSRPLSQAPPAVPPRTPNQNPDVGDTVGDAKADPGDYAEALYRCGPAQLEELRGRLQAVTDAGDSTARSDLLGEMYIGVHTLVSEALRAELGAFRRLASAVEGLLRKLLDRSEYCTASTLETVAAAFSLLNELCRAQIEPVLDGSPIRILVVDDDPIARRAVAGAVQMLFGKPTTAESGEAALAAAGESPFDLILLDVLMPGMDGFTTCSKLSQTALNERAPVVFVSSQSDVESRRQAAAAGGCGFIPKPFLPAELTVTVLTFVLRGRLGQLMSSSR